MQPETQFWRKGWDSNPRYPCRHAGFQDRCLKPLGHPSKPLKLFSYLRDALARKAVCICFCHPTPVVRLFMAACWASSTRRGRGVLLRGLADLMFQMAGLVVTAELA